MLGPHVQADTVAAVDSVALGLATVAARDVRAVGEFDQPWQMASVPARKINEPRYAPLLCGATRKRQVDLNRIDVLAHFRADSLDAVRGREVQTPRERVMVPKLVGEHADERIP